MAQHILTQIHAGMPVYDQSGAQIGKVGRVYLGTVGDRQDVREEQGDSLDPVRPVATSVTDAPGEDALVNPTGPLLASDADLPSVHRAQLLREGFIRIDDSASETAGFALPAHIASVSDESVHLEISLADLL